MVIATAGVIRSARTPLVPERTVTDETADPPAESVTITLIVYMPGLVGAFQTAE